MGVALVKLPYFVIVAYKWNISVVIYKFGFVVSNKWARCSWGKVNMMKMHYLTLGFMSFYYHSNLNRY